MKYIEIFDSKLLKLPILVSHESNCINQLKKLYKEYMELMRSVEETQLSIDRLYEVDKQLSWKNAIEVQEEFTSGILKSLELYLEGKPADAYLNLRDVIDKRKSRYTQLFSLSDCDIGTSFYRIRRKEENYPLSSTEMFHIPFHKRNEVSTMRYSIPGFPSLYMGKTIYIAWEEMRRPSLDSFQVVRLSTKRKLKFLNLTSKDIKSSSDYMTYKGYKYLMAWPLIAACSIKVRNPKDVFKCEYVIPQMLLQWVRCDENINGIIYESTHVEKAGFNSVKGLYNIVMPVVENKDDGYCSTLMNSFEMTDTISHQLIEFASGGQPFFHSDDEYHRVDEKLEVRDIIQGRKLPYSYSVLGKLEMLLDVMPLKSII